MENWTIEELAERVADALAAGYPGQPSARVREVPDRRTIRWYTTTGLVDRPAAMRGRTALYGRRHLLQLVAIKRLQAQGLSLANIQEKLLHTDDRTLEAIAALPTPVAGDADSGTASGRGAARSDGGAGTGSRVEEAPARARFWAAPAQPASLAGSAQSAALATQPAGINTHPASDPGTHPASDPGTHPVSDPAAQPAAPGWLAPLPDDATIVPAIRLDGVTVLLDAARRSPTPSELAALRTAAAPLLDLLHQLDLTEGTP